MDYTILDELIAIQKKSDANKEKKALYVKEIVNLLEEEGISEKSVYYLLRGSSFCGALPFAEYLKRLPEDSRQDVVKEFFLSPQYKNEEQAYGFRFAISFLGYTVTWFAMETALLMQTILVIPTKAYNKDKKLLKDASKTVDKYFFSMINPETVLPDLTALDIKKIFICDFRAVLLNAMETINSKPAKNKVEIWLAEKEQNEQSIIYETEKTPATNQTVSPAEKEESIQDIEAPHIIDKIKADKAITNKELGAAISYFALFAKRLAATLNELDDIKKASAVYQQQLESANQTIIALQHRLNNTLAANTRLSEEITISNNTVADLQVKLINAETIIESKTTLTENLQKELEKMKSVLSVYNADKQNAQSEQLNAIASKLKSEYRDFKDAENEEMTLDLGENFRFQLQSIFRILAKAGIDIEKR